MMELILGGIMVGVALISFGAGGLAGTAISERKYRQELQRKVRPAHIHIHRTSQVQEYIVQPGALDISFPNTEECV
jgi:hypothetical protein